MSKGINYQLKGYCELVDTTDRYITENEIGYIDTRHNPIIER